MGRSTARDLANGDFTLRQALSIHLTSNHYPPVPKSMIDACIASIDACNEGDFERMVNLPAGVSWRGALQAPASAIAEAHHLDEWISPYDE